MSQIFIHLGLHKTATKFLQHKVFVNIPEKIIYNPPLMKQLLCDLVKADDADVKDVIKEIQKEKLRLLKTGKKILLSREIISGDLYTLYKNVDLCYSRLGKCFKEAKIICFFRYQTDWLLSCYRESLHTCHFYQTLEEYFQIKAKKNYDFDSIDYKELDYGFIISELEKAFHKDNLKFLFYEDLKNNKQKTVDDIAKLLGLETIKIKHDKDKIPNRGYSAFSIYLSIYRFKIFKFFNLHTTLIHRPIRLFGKNSVPSGFPHLTILPKAKYWDNFLQDNEEVRSPNYPDKLTILEKLRQEFSWRNFIKHRLDKLFYWDWDILGNHREGFDIYFNNQNNKLIEKYPELLNNMPEIYLRKNK